MKPSGDNRPVELSEVFIIGALIWIANLMIYLGALSTALSPRHDSGPIQSHHANALVRLAGWAPTWVVLVGGLYAVTIQSRRLWLWTRIVAVICLPVLIGIYVAGSSS